ncbi:dephospho-CoA kinase [bacterium DOLJORAL78_65_58]|nr:MAG: dephospho-CoA kinase [bacterium DOLJORAL78_65_58]
MVTGPVGAGKSTVARLLQRHGAALLDADKLGHEVLARPDMVTRVARVFGAGCVVDGAVDRRALGAIVFADRQAMDRLNALTHPPLLDLIGRRLKALEAAGKHDLAVLEAAVYFLWPPLEGIDRVISVLASETVRRRRLAARRGLDDEAITRILRTQDSLEPHWRRADILLWNDGTPKELEEAVRGLLNKLDRSKS